MFVNEYLVSPDQGSFRLVITTLIGVAGLHQKGLWKKLPLIFVWDATALVIWLLTFGRRSIRWRNVDYRIRDGRFVPMTHASGPNPSH